MAASLSACRGQGPLLPAASVAAGDIQALEQVERLA